ncbi:MAG TPA: HAD family phosphatase [Usitatibacter sp.]|jgi:putative hydrolase of the HAD superfamily
MSARSARSPSGEDRGEGRTVEALLFDLGGVLIHLDWDAVFAHWAACCGADPAVLRSRFTFDEPYERHERGEISARDYFQSLRETLGIELSNDDFRLGWERVFAGAVTPTVQLLGRIDPAMPLYLFSNTNAAHHAAWAHDYAQALAPFRRAFTSCEIGLRKPGRAAFHHVAREMGVAPERILFFDDTESNVEGARRAGLQAVHVRSPSDVERALRPWLRRAG